MVVLLNSGMKILWTFHQCDNYSVSCQSQDLMKFSHVDAVKMWSIFCLHACEGEIWAVFCNAPESQQHGCIQS